MALLPLFMLRLLPLLVLRRGLPALITRVFARGTLTGCPVLLAVALFCPVRLLLVLGLATLFCPVRLPLALGLAMLFRTVSLPFALGAAALLRTMRLLVALGATLFRTVIACALALAHAVGPASFAGCASAAVAVLSAGRSMRRRAGRLRSANRCAG